MAMTYKISEFCGDWALQIKEPGNLPKYLYFKSRNNAELVKSVLEWEDAHPNEAVPYQLAIPNLRPVSRDRVEKVWRGCSWCNNEGKKPENWECSLVDDRGFSVVVGDEVVWTNAEFCPVCGKPLTDEAVEMVMKRMETIR